MNKKSTIVLGIDPGYDRVGWAIGEKKASKNPRTTSNQLKNATGSTATGTFECIALGCIQTDKTENIFDRFKKIQSDLKEIITHFNPATLAIETVYFAKNKKTAMRVSEARGVIIGVCLEAGLEVREYDPVQIKLAVAGNGNADKQALEKMVRLQLKGSINTFIDDAIDAVAVAMTWGVTRI